MNHTSSSDSDSEDLSDQPDDIDFSRHKRRSSWCGPSSTSAISWPPSNPSSSNWRQLRPVKFGNPLYGTKMQLISKTKYLLAVFPDGTVRGTPDENDLHTYLEMVSAGYPGHVRIKGLLSNLYVAMDKRGRLYGEAEMMEESAVFIEAFQGSYNTYLSRKFAHLGWYIGIKKSGKFKRGPKTAYGQKVEGNPEFSNKMSLWCQTGHLLKITSDGTVEGTQDQSDPCCKLELITVDIGKVRVQCLGCNLYLCYNSSGNLYGEADPTHENTIFEETFQGQYTAYKSSNHDWYVGIKKNGVAKNGNRTARGQKAVKFLPIR